MVNSILDAVTTQLGKTFGTNYRYYVEDVKQNLTTPCFTIDALTPTERSKSPILYDRTVPVIVHYFSDSKTNLKQDCYKIAERVIECLEYLPYVNNCNTILRGEDISWQIVDNVLQIFMTYRFTTLISKDIENNMENISETITRTQ